MSDASSRPPSAASSVSASLAPGFRFHPTDEELVSYYLKRKVLSKPLRVDAISEIDLYKAEPWDLPQKSRIQSRDMEWYFFSPLDKKYSNRSRTNRTTGQGYWKTTGKDRAVRRGSRVVGMKKTLVFHVGRAPRGERTNWVMHEYRLEDEEFVKAGVPQDEYVVCRIFQKSGAGPQNGAQYGAPVAEEDWDNDESMLPSNEDGVQCPLQTLGIQQRPIMEDDFDHESKGLLNQNERDYSQLIPEVGRKTCNSEAINNGKNISDNPVGHQSQEITNVVDQKIDMHELKYDPSLIGNCENYGPQELPQSWGVSNDDYLELNDFANSLLMDYSSVQVPAGMRNDQISTNFFENASLPELHGVEEFFNNRDENVGFVEPLETVQPFLSKNGLESNDWLDPVMGDYPSGEQADDGLLYYDASSYNLAVEHGYFIETNDLPDPRMPESSSPDPVDELFAYFDATENKLQHSYSENPERLCSSSLKQTHFTHEVDADDAQAEASGASVGNGASSKVSLVDNEIALRNDKYALAQGIQSGKDWEKTIKGCLIGMLDSISSPPALAAEHPIKRGKSLSYNMEGQSSSSIHVTAGMIHIDGITMTENAKNWSLLKNGDMDFLLSYCITGSELGTTREKIHVGAMTMEKIHAGAMTMEIWGGLCLSFLPIMFLVLSFKLGVLICSW